jgi:hypothetical protein
MADDLDWLREGFRQLRLGLAWQRYAHAAAELPEVAAVGAAPADWLRETVLPALLRSEWLPGVRDLLACYEKHDGGSAPGQFSPEPFDRMERALAQALDRGAAPDPSAARPVSDFSAQLHHLLFHCHNDPGQDGLAAPPLPPLYLPADVMARAWLDAACAVGHWQALAPALEEDKTTAPRPGALAEDCGRLRAALAERRPSFLGALVGGGGQGTLLEEVGRVLQRCQEALGARERPEADVPRTERRRLLARIRDLIGGAGDWPPRLLANLRTTLVIRHGHADLADLLGEMRAAATIPALPDGPRPSQARAALALLLLENLDRRDRDRPLAAEVWHEVRNCVGRLLGPGVTVELVRAVSADPAGCQCIEADGAAEQVQATGLVAHTPTGTHVLRPARILVPRRPSNLEAALTTCAGMTADAEPALAALCRDVAAAVNHAASPEAWRDGLDVEGQAGVWRLLQRAAALAALRPPLRPVVEPVAVELGAAGFALTPVPRADGFGGGPWLLSADPGVREAVPLPATTTDGQGLGLRLPDGRVLRPAVWLRVPEAWAARRPVVRLLAECEPLVAGLKVLDPDWDHWATYNRQLWGLLYNPTAAAEPVEDVRVLKKILVLLALRARARDQDGGADGYRELARRLYRCMTADLGVRLVPELDPQTFQVLPLKGPPADGTLVVWEASPRPFGEVLRVRRFGSPGDPGHVHVSGGPELPAEIVDWLALPPTNFEGLPSSPHLVAGHPLPAWHAELQRLPWEPARAAAALAAHRDAFRRWVGTRAGLDWFRAFVPDLRQELAGEGVRHGRKWLAKLTQANWCVCVPAVDFTTNLVTWPAGLTTTVPGVRWEFSAEVPARRALAEPVTFAPNAALAQGTFSQGPRRPGDALDLATRLAEAAARPGRQALQESLGALLAATREHALAGTALPQPEMLALPVLDALAAVGWGDELPVLRGWCATAGLEVLPRRWEPGTEPPAADHPGECDLLPPAFGDEPPGTVRLKGLGLCAGSRVVRPYVTARSAGPAPPHYREIEGQLAALGAPAEELRAALAEWPAAALADNLPYQMTEFFAAFWRVLGQEFRDQHPEPFERLETLVNGLIEHQLNLSLLYPTKMQNQPFDWLTLRHGPEGVKTGWVRRVLQPGLINPDGSLRVRAIVEVE